MPAARLGLGYAYDGIKRLIDVVGPSFAKEIFYTARQFDSAEALQMGLVNRVVPAANIEAYVRDYAGTIGGNAPLTINAVKLCVNETTRIPRGATLPRRKPPSMPAFIGGLYRGPHRVYGEAQAGVSRAVSLAETASGEERPPPADPSSAGKAGRTFLDKGGGAFAQIRGAEGARLRRGFVVERRCQRMHSMLRRSDS